MSKVLVFGGTRFFGKDLVRKLVEEGHDVTIATRGRTKDSFGERVHRLIVDRNDRRGLETTFNQRQFDIVFDNLCYSPNAALAACDIFRGRVGKYVLTSTLSVYDQGLSLKEENFNPYQYKTRYGEREDFEYGEGKRLAEAVFFQKADFAVVGVRFPVVIGANDYTGRLQSYFERISREIPFFIDNLECAMSFITASEGGGFLAWIAGKDFTGPINACCDGAITLKDIVMQCEEKTRKRWIPGDNTCREAGAFNGFQQCTMDNSAARKRGFQFRDVRTAVATIIGGFYDAAPLSR